MLINRRVAIGAALALLALGTSALVTASSVRRAAATCTGPGQPFAVTHSDGSCAYVYHLEPLAYSAQQGASCTTGVWRSFGYIDSVNTNSVLVSVRPSYLVGRLGGVGVAIDRSAAAADSARQTAPEGGSDPP